MDPTPTPAATSGHRDATSPAEDATLGSLMLQLSEQTSELVRSEIRLALAETNRKVKHGALGAASFGGAGLLGLYGLAVLLAAAVLGLAEALPAWLAALVVGLVVLVLAGVAALVGKRQVGEATPVVPEKAVSGTKLDVATLKGADHE